MAIRSKSWANLNETRAFPFADDALLVDDQGRRPPNDVLAGLKLLIPESLGRFVYVGALTVTPRIVTLIFLATDDPDVAGEPVAAISRQLPIVDYLPYALEGLQEGVGGWLAFGSGAGRQTYSGRFSTPRQALLAPLAARAYRTPPVPSAGVLGSDGLTGLVRLQGGNDIEIVKECREIIGHAVPSHDPYYCGDDELGTQVREVAVIRLRNKSGDPTINVFDQYRGRCSGRPESGTCGAPEPIEFLGPVAPDCNGNITIELRGCAHVSAVREIVTVDALGDEVYRETACGVIIDCGLGLGDACTTRDRLPDEEGRLPNEYDDLCQSISFASISEEPPAPEESFSFDETEASASADPELPLEDPLQVIGDYVIRMGSFALDDNDVLTAGSAAVRNIATYEPLNTPTGFYRRAIIRTGLAEDEDLPGALHNAAVIANYRETFTGSGKFEFFAAEIDWDGHYRGFKLFRIARFNGSAWITLAYVSTPTLELGGIYDISLEVLPNIHDPDDAWLYARLQGVSEPSLDIQIGPIGVNSYGPVEGPFGFATNRALSKLYTFALENVTQPPV